MIIRPDYIESIKPFMDKPLVKILAGVRRSGKSTILDMIKQELVESGVNIENVICFSEIIFFLEFSSFYRFVSQKTLVFSYCLF